MLWKQMRRQNQRDSSIRLHVSRVGHALSRHVHVHVHTCVGLQQVSRVVLAHKWVGVLLFACQSTGGDGCSQTEQTCNRQPLVALHIVCW